MQQLGQLDDWQGSKQATLVHLFPSALNSGGCYLISCSEFLPGLLLSDEQYTCNRKPNGPFPSLTCLLSGYLVTATEVKLGQGPCALNLAV